MYYSLEPYRYFLLSIFQVWSQYVKYPQLYEGTNERTYSMTKHITTLLLPSRVQMKALVAHFKIRTKTTAVLQEKQRRWCGAKEIRYRGENHAGCTP